MVLKNQEWLFRYSMPMTRYNIGAVIAIVAAIGFFASFFGVYGSGRTAGLINMGWIALILVGIYLMRRGAPKAL